MLTHARFSFPALVKCLCVCFLLFNLHFDTREVFLHAFLLEINSQTPPPPPQKKEMKKKKIT